VPGSPQVPVVSGVHRKGVFIRRTRAPPSTRGGRVTHTGRNVLPRASINSTLT
jgi:hypothetical protein